MRASSFSLPIVFTVVAFVAACATTGQATRGHPTLLTQEEIRAVGAANLYEVIERTRPRWLVVRGGTRSFNMPGGEILVYQDQTRLGGIGVLYQLRPDMASSIRFVDGQTASSTLPGTGGVHVAGAIVIHTR